MKMRSVIFAAIAALFLAAYSCNSAHTQPAPHQSVLRWIAYTAPTGTTATFTILRGTASGGPYPFTVTSTLAGDATTYTDSPLAQNSTYCWVIVVKLSNGNSSKPSPETCGTTIADPVPGVSGFANVTQ